MKASTGRGHNRGWSSFSFKKPHIHYIILFLAIYKGVNKSIKNIFNCLKYLLTITYTNSKKKISESVNNIINLIILGKDFYYLNYHLL